MELELATLQVLGSAPILQRPVLPNEKGWQTFPQPHLDMEWVLPQFLPSAKHILQVFWVAWISHTESIRWLPVFIYFIGSRGKTFIYFYGTHGLGDFFYIIKNEILGENSKIWFHGFLQYYT